VLVSCRVRGERPDASILSSTADFHMIFTAGAHHFVSSYGHLGRRRTCRSRRFLSTQHMDIDLEALPALVDELDSEVNGGASWWHLPLACLILGLALVLWRMAAWRRQSDDDYARVSLYEDRPFAYDRSMDTLRTPPVKNMFGNHYGYAVPVVDGSEDDVHSVQATRQAILEALDDDDDTPIRPRCVK